VCGPNLGCPPLSCAVSYAGMAFLSEMAQVKSGSFRSEWTRSTRIGNPGRLLVLAEGIVRKEQRMAEIVGHIQQLPAKESRL
jgi:hypothetical protein